MTRARKSFEADDPNPIEGPFGEEILHRYVEGELSGELALLVERWAERDAAIAEELARLLDERHKLTEMLASLAAPTPVPELPGRFAARVTLAATRELRARRRRSSARRLFLALPAAVIAAAFFVPSTLPEGGVEKRLESVVSTQGRLADSVAIAPQERPASASAPLSPVSRSSPIRARPAHFASLASLAPGGEEESGDCLGEIDHSPADDGIDPVFPPTVIVCRTCAGRPSDGPPATLDDGGRVRARLASTRGAPATADPIGYVLRHAPHPNRERTEPPCPPDPNADGVFDASDFVYLLQNEFTLAATPIERSAPASTSESDGCDEESSSVTSA